MTAVTDFLSPMSFKLPDWRPGGGWLEHGPFGMWIVEQVRPSLVVELGSYAGYSFAAFCEAMRAAAVDGRAVAVDTWEGDDHSGFYGDDVHDALKTYLDTHYPGMVEMKRMFFSQALRDVADGSIDLLHVDGRHYYDDVKEDYTSWIPKLSDRAVVLFHDTQIRDRGFGVWQYWSELQRDHPHTFEFHHGNGLGVLSPSGNLPPPLAKLLSRDLPPSIADDVRAAYARLGGAITAQRIADQVTARKIKRRAFRKAPIKHLVETVRSRLSR